jgi:spore germination protein GerM
MENTGFLDRLMNRPLSGEAGDDIPQDVLLPKPVNIPEPAETPGPAAPLTPPPAQEMPAQDVQPAPAVPAAAVPAAPAPAAPPIAAVPPAALPEPQQPPAQTERKDRSFYLMQVDREGVILRTRVTRNLPATSAPLQDALQALLSGPSEEEQRRGLMSLIPQGTRINSAVIRGSTAYINFNEEFQFNTYGVEGYVGSLRQVVWTATEFSSVKDVQILIDGRRVDYLGESIWIGGPISRDSLQ